VAIHVDAGDGALAHEDGGAAVAGNETAKELEEVGVVAHNQNAFAVSVPCQHLLKCSEIGVEAEGGADFDFGFIAQLRTHKLRCLQGALERAGDDNVELDLEGGEHARHEHALLFSVLDQSPLGVEGRVFAAESSVSVTHQVKVHS